VSNVVWMEALPPPARDSNSGSGSNNPVVAAGKGILVQHILLLMVVTACCFVILRLAMALLRVSRHNLPPYWMGLSWFSSTGDYHNDGGGSSNRGWYQPVREEEGVDIPMTTTTTTTTSHTGLSVRYGATDDVTTTSEYTISL